jgi:mannose-6-phosphate isomerase-like protein (cupin superfamily)
MHIRHSEVKTALWGDEVSGFVHDLYYVGNDDLAFLTVSMPSGTKYRSSQRFRSVLGSYNCIYMLSGQLTLQNPSSGEVLTANERDSILIPPNTWYHGYNFGIGDAQFIECIAPRIDRAATEKLKKPDPVLGWVASAVNNWPDDRVRGSMRLTRSADALGAIIGSENSVLAAVLASVKEVSFAVLTLPAASHSEIISFPHGVCYHGDSGIIDIELIDDGKSYLAVDKADVLYLPAGTRHRLFNHSSSVRSIHTGGSGSFGALKIHELSVVR